MANYPVYETLNETQQEGWDAYIRSESPEDNPYTGKLQDAWNEGWYLAEDTFENNDWS